MSMRFTEIGQQLRAYRLESGLRAEEIAARLGVSRAALYRYEKGEVIKLDTIKRLAELLKISPDASGMPAIDAMLEASHPSFARFARALAPAYQPAAGDPGAMTLNGKLHGSLAPWNKVTGSSNMRITSYKYYEDGLINVKRYSDFRRSRTQTR